jgi:hypothetical protein
MSRVAERPEGGGRVSGRSAEIKACGAASYGSDAVASLLGESYHPGGLSLTHRLAGQFAAAQRAAGGGCGAASGATARLLAADYDVTTLAKQAVTDGLIGYALLIAEKPRS